MIEVPTDPYSLKRLGYCECCLCVHVSELGQDGVSLGHGGREVRCNDVVSVYVSGGVEGDHPLLRADVRRQYR